MIRKGVEFVLLFDVVPVSAVEMGNLGLKFKTDRESNPSRSSYCIIGRDQKGYLRQDKLII
jgi:hypothetical protein